MTVKLFFTSSGQRQYYDLLDSIFHDKQADVIDVFQLS